MTRPTVDKIEGPKSSIRRRIREGESGRPVSGDKEGGAGRRVSADGADSSPLSAEADSFRMSHGGGGRSSAIRAPSKSAKSISDQGLPLLMSGMFAGGRLLPDAADRLTILQHDVVEKVGIDRRPDVELT